MTADPHLVYDIETLNRINYSKSIYIGDHVWIGQNSTILKGTKIDSGSIIGASSVVPGITVENNSTYVGNPARMVKNGIFWDGACVHKWVEKDTEKSRKYDIYMSQQENSINRYIFSYDEQGMISYDDMENYLKNNNLGSRLNFLYEISNNNHKNRFVHFETKNKQLILKKE